MEYWVIDLFYYWNHHAYIVTDEFNPHNTHFIENPVQEIKTKHLLKLIFLRIYLFNFHLKSNILHDDFIDK